MQELAEVRPPDPVAARQHAQQLPLLWGDVALAADVGEDVLHECDIRTSAAAKPATVFGYSLMHTASAA
ncbi:hypothetical protein [Nonomuraea sp. JJY05]|uniref:hypothetical protein n=1 Tax=Nonomuraea sp. JJY05 TaxID=3350255 RepID=UPI00373F73DB